MATEINPASNNNNNNSNKRKKTLFLSLFLFYMYDYFPHMYIHTPYIHVGPAGDKRGHLGHLGNGVTAHSEPARGC